METSDQLINKKGLEALIRHAVKNTYRTRCSDTVSEGFLQNSIALFSKDYTVSIIDNSWGELCGHYPSKIVILGHNCIGKQQSDDMCQLRELILRSRVARCRSRFVVPVILFNGKFICRSSTLSSGPEMYSRQLYNLVLGGSNDATAVPPEAVNTNAGDWQMFSRVRNQDILLLKKFNVGFIVDLMVEKKKVKYGLNVTSSEKVDKENRYAEFGIASIPFPGCEFFKEWKDNGYRTMGIAFDWTQGFVDALLELPTDPPPLPNIDWAKYKEWDIVMLTQNYLKLILNYLKQSDTGLLIHCISGWDRTPMFVSLVRLSLWSEGLVHQSLAPHEILYLTIAYDWYLFGHNFPDRIYKGEDVFYFCFHFLKYITDDEFNIYHRYQLIPQVEKQVMPKEQELPFPLIPCSRSSTNSINSNHSNGCSDDACHSDDENSITINSNRTNGIQIPGRSLSKRKNKCSFTIRYDCMTFSRNQESSESDTPGLIPAKMTFASDDEDHTPPSICIHNTSMQTNPAVENLTPTRSIPNSIRERTDTNHNSRPSSGDDAETEVRIPQFQRNSEPMPVPSPGMIGMPDIRGSTPNSYGSVSERRMKLMAVHNLFVSVYKSVSEPSVPESNSGLGLSNLFESLFGNYRA